MASALILSPEVPYPVVGGGPMRTASLFEYFGARFELDAITFRQPGAADPRKLFPPGKVRNLWVVDLPMHSKSPAARATRNLKRAVQNRPPLIDRFSGFEFPFLKGRQYDLGVIEHFWCAAYEAQLRPHCPTLWLDLHNLESEWHRTLAQSEGGVVRLAHRRFAMACSRMEAELLPRFDKLLVTSKADADRIQVPTAVYPNTIPLIPAPVRNERHTIVFTGNLEYQPNISAVRYFSTRIWPAIRQADPQVTWELVGKNPHAVAALVQDDPRIQLTGPVDDAVGRIANARLAVVPLLAGSGTRIKILEAWAAATPVVSTTLGAEGLNYTPGEELLVADTPDAFAQAVLKLLRDASLRGRMGAAGRLNYELCYTWESAWTVLETHIERMHPNFERGVGL